MLVSKKIDTFMEGLKNVENVKVEAHNAIGNGKDIAVIDSNKVILSQAKMD